MVPLADGEYDGLVELFARTRWRVFFITLQARLQSNAQCYDNPTIEGVGLGRISCFAVHRSQIIAFVGCLRLMLVQIKSDERECMKRLVVLIL